MSRMSNPRISKKERGLIKGALRRVFSRSDLRRSILDEAVVEHTDSTRTRVKTWVKCSECGKLDAKSNMDVDHQEPVIPLESTLEHMTWDELVDRLWCDKKNLAILCESCHSCKTSAENKARRQYKKDKKKNGKSGKNDPRAA